jgi:ABC-type transport system involved in multi-copper enzyme maturation permease subunit
MSPSLRKFALTAHVTSSVGWLGAVVVFLALAIAGVMSREAQVVRASYVALEIVGWAVIVPLSVASLLSGVIQSLGTTWGLFRHYWIVAKLAITVGASVLLLLHMQVASRMAGVASMGDLAAGDFHGLRIQLIADAAAAVVVLLVATALSVYKPAGLTPYGRRQLGPEDVQSEARIPRWVQSMGIAFAVLVAIFVLIKHLSDGGFRH